MEYLVFDKNIAKRWQRVKKFVAETRAEDFWNEIRQKMRELLKEMIEIGIEEEMEVYIGSERYKHLKERVDYRNGYYYRNLDTGFGPIDNIKVCRCRKGLFRTKIFDRYSRRQKGVEEMICNVFLRGISTREVSCAIAPVLESTFSSSCVSRITKRLDKFVEGFHRRELIDEYEYLFLDGITLKVKGALKVEKKVILVAYGITMFGKRELIGFRIASSESERAWEGFLNDLQRRGLKGENLRLIITDGSRGLKAACDMVFAYVKRQHCWVHKLRNVAKYLRKRDEKEVLSELKRVYTAENKRKAVSVYKAWRRHWQKEYPKAVECVEKDIDELLNFMDFPERHRIKIRTTNVIERCFREIRRRIRLISCFTNHDSCNRIIYAIFNHLNEKWKDRPLKEFTQFI
jgi:transposase-like protein